MIDSGLRPVRNIEVYARVCYAPLLGPDRAPVRGALVGPSAGLRGAQRPCGRRGNTGG